MASQLPLFGEAQLHAATELELARASSQKCVKCDLSKTRTTVVFGEGNANRPPIALVGEAPGQKEDEQGRPFVGRSGALLEKMLAAIGFKRSDVYICNCVCCRPPQNRPPEPREVAACSPFLVRQLRCIQPRTIVLLGATAANTLLGKDSTMKSLRNKWYSWCDVPTRVTYHPAYLLRTPDKKGEAFEDLKAIQAKVKELTRT